MPSRRLSSTPPRRGLRKRKQFIDLRYLSDSEDGTPKASRNQGRKTYVEESDADEEGASDDELYDVHKLIGHRTNSNGYMEFNVEWENGDEATEEPETSKKRPTTWEPEASLRETIPEILAEYKENIKKRQKEKKRLERRPLADPEVHSKKRRKLMREEDSNLKASSPEWKPPSQSWEDHIHSIDLIEDTGEGGLISYVTWVNGRKTRQDMDMLREKCPQKLLQYLIGHLVFGSEKGTGDEEVPGDTE